MTHRQSDSKIATVTLNVALRRASSVTLDGSSLSPGRPIEGDKVEEVEGVPFSLNVRGNIANVANFGSQARHCEHWEHSVPFKNAAAWTS